MNEHLSAISAFVYAADAGSFALAAQRLHLTRSAVSKSIARLEQRLGVRLFHRTTRQQSLTEDGAAYYERCVRALAELDAGAAALADGRREPSGTLRVSAPVMFGRHCVAPILVALARRHPRLNIEMSFTDRVVDLVEEGFDLVVRIGPLPDTASLAARHLGTQSMGIGAAPSYLVEYGQPSTPEDLARHIGIVYRRPGYAPTWRIRDGAGRVHETRIDARLCFDDLQAIADAAVAGAGLAWLPCWLLARYMRTGELTLVMDSERVLASEIHALWPQTRYLPSKTRAAIDALAAEIPGLVSRPADHL